MGLKVLVSFALSVEELIIRAKLVIEVDAVFRGKVDLCFGSNHGVDNLVVGKGGSGEIDDNVGSLKSFLQAFAGDNVGRGVEPDELGRRCFGNRFLDLGFVGGDEPDGVSDLGVGGNKSLDNVRSKGAGDSDNGNNRIGHFCYV